MSIIIEIEFNKFIIKERDNNTNIINMVVDGDKEIVFIEVKK